MTDNIFSRMIWKLRPKDKEIRYCNQCNSRIYGTRYLCDECQNEIFYPERNIEHKIKILMLKKGRNIKLSDEDRISIRIFINKKNRHFIYCWILSAIFYGSLIIYFNFI